MLRSDLCYYNDAYIVVTGKITVTNPNNNAYDKKLALKNNAPFFSCISKISGTLIDNVEDLDIVTPMYNLLQYSKNYTKTTGRLWNYYIDEPNSIYQAIECVSYLVDDGKHWNHSVYPFKLCSTLGQNK